jgi:hypothetical protein
VELPNQYRHQRDLTFLRAGSIMRAIVAYKLKFKTQDAIGWTTGTVEASRERVSEWKNTARGLEDLEDALHQASRSGCRSNGTDLQAQTMDRRRD